MSEPTLEQVMIRAMAIIIVKDVCELRGLLFPQDYETKNALAEKVIADVRKQAMAIMAKNGAAGGGREGKGKNG